MPINRKDAQFINNYRTLDERTMKVPSKRIIVGMALNSLQARDPILFENSFQTLTSSSLSWIDEAVLSRATKLSFRNDTAKQNPVELSSLNSTQNENADIKYHVHRAIAEASIRRMVFKILDKYTEVSSPELVEEALKYHTLPETLKDELVTKYGGSPPITWLDALDQLKLFCSNDFNGNKTASDEAPTMTDRFQKERFWELILDHPITSYVPVQCQSCDGYIVPDSPNSSRSEDADLGLREEKPLPKEAPFVRMGWFRGPRLRPNVFVLDCPKCGANSRWFRSRSPIIILNPRRWGRLCGEQEDLRLDLANYFGFISIRTIIPLDWDHIWSEFHIIDEDGDSDHDEVSYTSKNWRIRDDDSNFAARLDEGIGYWTKILAVSPNPDFCGDVTNYYLLSECKGGHASDNMMRDMNRYRQCVSRARQDHSGLFTQAGTVNGYVIQRAGLTSPEITSIMKRAATEYGNQTWYQI